MIKHLITDGCSFTANDKISWPIFLTGFLESKNNNLTSVFAAYPGHGNGMIQKRTILNVTEALDSGLNPEEILVVVMWSGNSRSAWYVDNPDMIKMFDLPSNSRKLRDLKNLDVKTGGWHNTEHGGHAIDKIIEVSQQYYMLDEYPGGVGKVHDSLENIIMLQNFCKLKGVKLIQQFYMNSVFEDFEKYKDHQIINYLYKQLDFDSIIKQGMLEYIETFLSIEKPKNRMLTFEERLDSQMGMDLFEADGLHPGLYGAKLWCKNMLLPFVKSKNI